MGIRLAATIGLSWLMATSAGAQTAPVDARMQAAQTNVRLGVEYLKKGEIKIARDKIERALKQQPRDVSVQLAAGLLYERLGESDRAGKHYREALKVDAKSPEAQNAYGSFLCRNGDPERGEAVFIQAATNPLYRTPDIAYANAGTCARGAKRLAEAEGYLRKALAARPNNADVLQQLAGVTFERGNALASRAFVQRYLAAAPANAEVLLLGHRVETQLGDRVAARQFGDRLMREFPASTQASALTTGVASQP